MKQFPPIWSWIIAAALVLFGALYLHFTASARNQLMRVPSFERFTHQLNQFLENYEPNPDQLRVICWGSSLSRQAIENSEVFHNEIASDGLNVDVQKVYMASANANMLPYLHEFFDVSESLKPHLICIEDHLFAYAEINRNDSKVAKEFRFLIDNLIKGPSIRKKRPSRGGNFDTFHNRFESNQRKDTLVLPPYNRSVLSFSEHNEIVNKLSFALDQKIPIVVLNVPRAGAIEKFLGTPKVEADIETLIDSYRALGFQIEYWKFPSYLPFTHYSDYAHMNASGRKVYSKWLRGEITRFFQTESLQ